MTRAGGVAVPSVTQVPRTAQFSREFPASRGARGPAASPTPRRFASPRPLQEQHDHVIEISGAGGTVELCAAAAAILLVVLAGSVALRLDDGVESLERGARAMIAAVRVLALGGLVRVDVDRAVVHLDLHYGVHRMPAASVGRRRAGHCRHCRG